MKRAWFIVHKTLTLPILLVLMLIVHAGSWWEDIRDFLKEWYEE